MRMHRQYKGRFITFWAVQRNLGWAWAYEIDGGPVRSNETRLLSTEGDALKEAERFARMEIDGG